MNTRNPPFARRVTRRILPKTIPQRMLIFAQTPVGKHRSIERTKAVSERLADITSYLWRQEPSMTHTSADSSCTGSVTSPLSAARLIMNSLNLVVPTSIPEGVHEPAHPTMLSLNAMDCE